MQINIRPATLTDAKQIAAVHITAWQAAYKDLLPAEILENLSLQQYTKNWQQYLIEGVKVWVIELKATIIGFASVCPSRDTDADPLSTAEISAMYIYPNYWQCGYGTQLLNTVIQAMQQMNFKEITLWVLETNYFARSFYEKIGFKTTANLKKIDIGGTAQQVIQYKLRIEPFHK